MNVENKVRTMMIMIYLEGHGHTFVHENGKSEILDKSQCSINSIFDLPLIELKRNKIGRI